MTRQQQQQSSRVPHATHTVQDVIKTGDGEHFPKKGDKLKMQYVIVNRNFVLVFGAMVDSDVVCFLCFAVWNIWADVMCWSVRSLSLSLTGQGDVFPHST
jgi:hypothetical protein